MAFSDLREFLGALEREDLLRHVKAEVDKNWEFSAISRWMYIGFPEEERFALLFDNVKGFQMPVVVGAIGASYKTYALALDIDPHRPRNQVIKEIRNKWNQALEEPLKPRLVTTGPCKENI